MARKVYLGPRLDLTPDQAALLVTLRLWCDREQHNRKWNIVQRTFLAMIVKWLWSLLNTNTAGGYIEPHGDPDPDRPERRPKHPEGGDH